MFILHFLIHLCGIDYGLSYGHASWYNFWSGFGSDLGLFGAAGTLYWKHNCHQDRCWRIGRYPSGDGYHHCYKHRKDKGDQPND